MKRSLSFALCILTALAFAPADEIDDSSYESLFKAAYQSEMQSHPQYETLDAIVKFNGLDLFILVRPEGTQYTQGIAERLFRAGRIDEGVAFLKEMLPDRGYVSEALLEQKRFDEAWQLANSGLPQEHAGNIANYIQRTVAKNYYAKEPSDYASIPRLPPYVPNKADAEIYRAEANRALEHLVKLSEQVADEKERERIKSAIPQALAALGRSDEAYNLVKDVPFQVDGVLRTILKERRENGTQEEVDQWFSKIRKLYDDGKIRGGIDWSAETTFIWYCTDAGKYLDAMDAIENYAKRTGRTNRGTSGSPDGYFDRLPKLNVETEFRHNSKELLDRMIKYHDKVAADGSGVLERGNRYQFYPNIVKAQLNLNLVDDALASLRKMTGALEALEALGDIVFYAVKHKPPREAGQIEASAIEIFKNVEEITKNRKADSYLHDYYAELAIRLMKEGEEEKGADYMFMVLGKPEGQVKMCHLLITNDFLDKAAELVAQIEKRSPAPNIHLQIAKKQAEEGETEKAKAALQKAHKTFLQKPSLNYTEYMAMATLAATLDDKELFYEILNACITVANQRTWSRGGGSTEALNVFLRQLAVYGDKEHPLFAQAEEFADGIKDTSTATNYTGDWKRKGDLYMSLGVSRAMLGDHEHARRLLKEGIETRQTEKLKTLTVFCAPIIESRSYEKR